MLDNNSLLTSAEADAMAAEIAESLSFDPGPVLTKWLPHRVSRRTAARYEAEGLAVGELVYWQVQYNAVDAWIFEQYDCIVDAQGYVRAGKDYAHRRIMQPQPGRVVDHVNGDKLDLRRDNLQNIPPGQNTRRTPRSPNTGRRGIYRQKNGSYQVQIGIDGKRHTSVHGTLEEAIARREELDTCRRRRDFAESGFVELKITFSCGLPEVAADATANDKQ